MKTTAFLFTVLLIFVTSSYGTTSTYNITVDSIYKHVSILADDSLEGRQVGEPGELKAANYIRDIFQKAGLKSHNIENYFQYYDFIKLIDFSDKNKLVINGQELTLYEDFQPLKQSASMTFEFDTPVFVDYGN